MKKCIVILCLSAFLLAPGLVSGQDLSKSELVGKVRAYRTANEHAIVREYMELLSVPNVAADRENIRRNAELIRRMMERRGITARVMETKGNPVVYGELKSPGAEQTIMFYAHYDGQPVDPAKWTDSEPFKPVLRPGKLEAGTAIPKPAPFPAPGENFTDDWRIYARASSDDKAPIMAMLAALDALRDAGLTPTSNMKFIFEGEEEAGSTNLKQFCLDNRGLLGADVLFICDGPVYYDGCPTLYFGVRGVTSLSITVYGPNTGLHSGHYGNWAPSPGMRLAQLLATMKDKDGKVLIDGFYDTVVPLSPRELEALEAIPPFDEHLKELYGFSHVEGGGMSLMETINLPSFNFRGIQSGWVGSQARTIIPADATVSIDIRMVKGNTGDYMIKTVVDHIRKQGYHVVSEDPDQETRMKYPYIAKVTNREGGGTPAARTSMDLPISQKVIAAMSGISGREIRLLPTLGGTVPIYIFTDFLDLPCIGVPIVNYDNNQHGFDENLRIGHFRTGIETFAMLFMMR